MVPNRARQPICPKNGTKLGILMLIQHLRCLMYQIRPSNAAAGVKFCTQTCRMHRNRSTVISFCAPQKVIIECLTPEFPPQYLFTILMLTYAICWRRLLAATRDGIHTLKTNDKGVMS